MLPRKNSHECNAHRCAARRRSIKYHQTYGMTAVTFIPIHNEMWWPGSARPLVCAESVKRKFEIDHCPSCRSLPLSWSAKKRANMLPIKRRSLEWWGSATCGREKKPRRPYLHRRDDHESHCLEKLWQTSSNAEYLSLRRAKWFKIRTFCL